MFLRLTTENRDGIIEPRLVHAEDISVIKPAGKQQSPARSCISLRSQPEFPVWAIEDVCDIEMALGHMGCRMAPHRRRS